MEKVEYSDIVFLEKLNEIKTTIHNSGFRIDYRKAYDVDRKMRHVIDCLLDPHTGDDSLVRLYKELDMRVNLRHSLTLVYYYFALYQDNLPLLRRMLQEDVGLFDEEENFTFELLDQNFSQYFTEDQYLYLVRYCREELLSFYRNVFSRNHMKGDMFHRRELLKELGRLSEKLFSTEKTISEKEKKLCEDRIEEISDDLKTSYTYRYSPEEMDRYCKKFASIMTKDPFICKRPETERDQEIYTELLSPEVFDLYGEDQILQMSDSEKNLVSSHVNNPNALERIKHLFEKYPDFHASIRLEPEVLQLFTDEELYHFPEEKVSLYERALREGVISRVRSVEKSNQAIVKHPGIVNKIVFDTLSDEEISHLSERAVGKISNLVLHTRVMSAEEEYRIQRHSVWIMRFDKVIQKVKKILI